MNPADRKQNVKLMFVHNGTEHRLLQLNPTILKLAAWAVPFISVLILSIFIVLSYILYQKLSNIKSDNSRQSETLLTQNNAYQEQVEDMNKQILELNEKLTAPADNASSLQLFVTTKGHKDLTAQTLINIENLSFSVQGNKLNLKFELQNQSGSERMTGYFFVLTYTAGQLIFYPPLAQVSTELNFSQGETFNIGRFKNVIFNTPLLPGTQDQKIKIKIVAFSRAGDLLINKSFDLQ